MATLARAGAVFVGFLGVGGVVWRRRRDRRCRLGGSFRVLWKVVWGLGRRLGFGVGSWRGLWQRQLVLVQFSGFRWGLVGLSGVVVGTDAVAWQEV